jgi:hypothetical protein
MGALVHLCTVWSRRKNSTSVLRLMVAPGVDMHQSGAEKNSARLLRLIMQHEVHGARQLGVK